MVTQPQKEDEILTYIEKNSQKGKWSKLTLLSLVKTFADKKFPAPHIKKIINNLESTQELISKRLEYDFYILSNMEYEVDKKLLNHTTQGKTGSYFLAFILYILLIGDEKILEWYLGFIQGNAEKLTAYTILSSGLVISFLFIWLIGKIFQKIWGLYKREEINIVKHLWVVYAYVVLILIAVIFYFVFKGIFDVSPVTLFYSTLILGTAINAFVYQLKRR